MNKLPEQIIENVFPEERNKFFAWLKLQKRNLKSWLVAFLIIALIPLFNNFQTVVVFLVAPQ